MCSLVPTYEVCAVALSLDTDIAMNWFLPVSYHIIYVKEEFTTFGHRYG